MANFIEAAATGLAAATKMEADRNEIASVVADLSSAIARATQQKIKVAIAGKARKTSLAGMVMQARVATPQNYEALIFVAGEAGQEPLQAEIAEWATVRGGYPVKLRFNGREISSIDKKGLEHALSEVLANPETGAKLKALLLSVGIQSLDSPSRKR